MVPRRTCSTTPTIACRHLGHLGGEGQARCAQGVDALGASSSRKCHRHPKPSGTTFEASVTRMKPSERPALVINGAFRGQRVTGQQRYATDGRRCDSGRRPCEELRPPDQLSLSRIGNWAWTQSALALRSRNDLLLSLTSRAPVLHSRHVVTVHDLFPLTHPEWYSRRYVSIHGPLLKQLLRSSLGVVTVSQPVHDQIRERASLPGFHPDHRCSQRSLTVAHRSEQCGNESPEET